MSGAEILAQLPSVPVAGTAFNLTAFSYNGQFDMALAVDPTAVAEPAELRQHLDDGYAELLEAGGVRPNRLTGGTRSRRGKSRDS